MKPAGRGRGDRQRSPLHQDGTTRVLGYIRVSTTEQVDSGLGLAAQRKSIRSAAEQRGWDLVRVIEDRGVSARTLDRPGLVEAIDAVERGEAHAILVAKLDRLSRSLLDFAGLMERSRRKGWAVIALDLGVDTTTPTGEMMANVLATFAQFERRIISQRTKDALAEKRSQGVKLGRPRTLPAEVVERIAAEREAGYSLAAIADGLNADGVPTSQGGASWYPSSIRAVLAYAQD